NCIKVKDSITVSRKGIAMYSKLMRNKKEKNQLPFNNRGNWFYLVYRLKKSELRTEMNILPTIAKTINQIMILENLLALEVVFVFLVKLIPTFNRFQYLVYRK